MHKYFITIFISGTLFLGCSDNDTKADIPVDASLNPESVSYLVGSYFAEGSDESEFEVLIGGQVRSSWQRLLPWEEYLSKQTIVEVRHKLSGKLLSRETVTPNCSEFFASTESADQCVQPSGQIGLGSSICRDGEGAIFSTGTGCENTCFVLGCSPDFHCGTVLAHEDPELIQYHCVPVGAVAVGGSCSFRDDGFSNCKEGSGCIDGTCKKFCSNPGEKGQCGDALCMEPPVIDWVWNWGICE